MQILGPTDPAPSKQELIAALSKPIARVISSEMADESDVDRVWILRKIHKNYLYYRDLAYFAPALYQGLIDATGVDGSVLPDSSWQGNGVYDYTQNIYRGYCRKLEAVLGTRIPNAIAVPNDPSDEKDIQAARAANNAALYIREQCDLQVQVLWLVFSLYNFGTSFWTIEWVEDGDKYGWKDVPQLAEETAALGGGTQCPECGATGEGDMCSECGGDMSQGSYQSPTPVSTPGEAPPKRMPKGNLEIEITDASEVSVPLDADGRQGVNDCDWIRREREKPKARLLKKYGDLLRNAIKDGDNAFEDQSASLQYGESIRSAMASPIGVVRPKRESRWGVIEEDWSPTQYELIEDKQARQLISDNFPDGVRITAIKGHVMDLEGRKIQDHWQECQPEPTKRIMADPLGDDWVITQDILNNILNQCNETIERSNDPRFADPTRVDLDAWQRRRDNPGDLIPAVRPPGGSLNDLISQQTQVTFSEQIPPFRQQVEATSQQTSGLLEIIWGGDTTDPTARQSELKTNAAIRQLSVIWVMIGKSLERLYEKGCKLLSENQDGVLAFSKQKANEYGKFDSVSVVMEDLKGGNFHFEADEAIPMTWGQQRDLLMWMLDKPAEILKAWGLDDPLNIFEFKTLLGMPGMRVPHLDDRDKGMDVIGRLLQDKPQPGPIDPQTGQPGPSQSSIQPDWEDDGDFFSKLAIAYLITNFEMKESNPDGYQNVQLWGQAQQKKAQEPPPKPPVKPSVAVSLKGSDLGDPAVTAALTNSGILPQGVQAAAVPPLPKPGQMPPPGMPPAPLGGIQ
jgi:hypothetical protein